MAQGRCGWRVGQGGGLGGLNERSQCWSALAVWYCWSEWGRTFEVAIDMMFEWPRAAGTVGNGADVLGYSWAVLETCSACECGSIRSAEDV